MEHAMNEQDLIRLNAAMKLGWESCVMKPEYRGPDFPGTEDFPMGWFKAGVLVTTDGTVHHSVEPHHIELSRDQTVSRQYCPSEAALSAMKSQ